MSNATTKYDVIHATAKHMQRWAKAQVSQVTQKEKYELMSKRPSQRLLSVRMKNVRPTRSSFGVKEMSSTPSPPSSPSPSLPTPPFPCLPRPPPHLTITASRDTIEYSQLFRPYLLPYHCPSKIEIKPSCSSFRFGGYDMSRTLELPHSS